ncbi:MAG: Glycerophosphoryl diester phosphodiesterase [uncultured Rubrobacteraceae bacterium]|uniref:Glycerophosphoryl diester phosphodiesterase n=1 Tax=uncultured Rubrobacteraceae bacterium TaxID=349277 RepID=A0A6J4PRM4_9ACTN|nr:MAG: Glycerophosphoryl diester phosphodiesterase [uncultured Rubrobacteraceae bacterium]
MNEPEEMRRALETGVDGIVTDRPDLLAGLAVCPKSTH